MMKFRVGEYEYEIRDLIDGAANGDLRDLRKLTKGMLDLDEGTFQGVSPATFKRILAGTARGMAEIVGDADPDAEPDEDMIDKIADLLESDDLQLHLSALVWLAHRRAGNPISFDEADQFPRNSRHLINVPDDEPEGGDSGDPKDQSEAADDSPPKPVPTKKTTSKRPSTPGSR